MSCIICKSEDNQIFFNFTTECTIHSSTPIKSFCEKIIGNFFNIECNDESICELCFNSLNEIDYLEKKTREITENFTKRYQAGLSTEIKIDEDEPNDIKSMLEFGSDSLLETEAKKPNTIHFSNENDLKSILNDKIKEEPKTSDGEGTETEVNILYDMMDEKNIGIVVASKKNEIKKVPRCNKCSKTFETSQELKKHIATHNNEKPYICEVCGKVYRHKAALDIHVGMHKGINPFKCLYCNKTFTQKGALIRHVKIHTGEKPFQCEQCGKCFTHHTSFNVHKISHSGEKSYKCEICGLGLISTSHLKRHMRVHTGEKKYSCSSCGKRFAERYNLVSHQKLHTSGTISVQRKKFKCDICHSSFPKRLELEEHVMKAHPSTENINYMFLIDN